MNRGQRHSSSIALLDFLFNLLLAFVCLVVLLLMQAKSTNTSAAPKDKNEVIVQASWNDGSNDDVDLWGLDPAGQIVGFRHREAPGMFLQRDDTGRSNKFITDPNTGKTIEDPKNFEIINIGKLQPGRYVFNIHLYRADEIRTTEHPDEVVTVTVRVTKINPFREFAPVTLTIPRTHVGEEDTAIGFTVNGKGEIADTDSLPTKFVLKAISDTNSTGVSF